MNRPNRVYKKFLLEKGIQQNDVGHDLGFSKAFMSNVANGKQNITVSVLAKLMKYHKCKAKNIVDFDYWASHKRNKRKTKNKSKTQKP